MVLSSHSRCMILTWGRSFDPLFPTSKADMWSLWLGRVLHTLVTFIAEPNGDPWRVGTQPNSDLVEYQRDIGIWTHTWKGNLVFYLNSLFATFWESGIFFSHFQTLFQRIIPTLFCWYESNIFGVSWWEDLVWDDWVHYGDFGCMIAGEWCLAVDVNLGVGGWQTRHLRLANNGYMKEIDRYIASSISLTDTPFGKAHDNTR